jgi:hypothetical protein
VGERLLAVARHLKGVNQPAPGKRPSRQVDVNGAVFYEQDRADGVIHKDLLRPG